MTDDLVELMTAWCHGWAISRDSPPPVPILGGFRVQVEYPGRTLRHVLHTWDETTLQRLGRDMTEPGAGIKIVGTSDELRATLAPGWTMREPGWLMTTTFQPGSARPVDPYTAQISMEGRTHVVHILDVEGEIAAWARLAPSGTYGIVDRVWTRTQHQRRGLGTVMMQLLADRAVDAGLTGGILSASNEGRSLYLALGWIVRSDLAGAFRADTTAG